MNLGKAIKLARTGKNLTQRELAKKTKLSVSYISLLEKGIRSPNISILETIANALKIPSTILIFIGAEEGDLPQLSKELQEKLVKLAFDAITHER